MKYYMRSVWTWGVIVGLCTLLSSCNFLSANKSPEEQLQLSLGGLAGIETLTFTGEAALRRNEQRWFEQHFAYEGQLTNHDLLSMQTKAPIQSASAKNINKTQEEGRISDVSADLRRFQGGWVNTSSVDSHMDKLLVRFNPLSQLDGVAGLNKSIQEETSASRGTRVLRIELKSEDALKWLDHQLSSEMEALRTEYYKQNATYSPETQTELEAIWRQGEEQLQTMLKEAEVDTVYHLTIDRKSNFPLRLTSESKISFLDLEGNEQNEIMVNDVVFQM
ncbi:hypothetical protein ACP8HI_13110 [Paenibacillus sp. FA6]|uniref:hypothetical protein n=1 Tax=Paenibacillus sp. FA6 TaxID=3413029 RepID=UPI003F65B4E3